MLMKANSRAGLLLEFAVLKAGQTSAGMGITNSGDGAGLCEHCGSPLDESGLCWSCGGTGFASGSSSVGTAPLDKSELARVLRRGIGDKAHGAYSLSMQQAEGMSHLRDEIESMVEQFNASSQIKNSVKQAFERNAVKLAPELGPTKAAIASVAQEFLSRGRNIAEVSFYIARVHPRVGRLSSLVLKVYAPDQGRGVEVLVNSRRREFKSYSDGLYRRLTVGQAVKIAVESHPAAYTNGALLVRLVWQNKDGYRSEPPRDRLTDPESIIRGLR